MTPEMQLLARQILDNGIVTGEKFIAQSRALAVLVANQQIIISYAHLLSILPVGVSVLTFFEEVLDHYLEQLGVRKTRRQKVKEGVRALVRQAQEENE